MRIIVPVFLKSTYRQLCSKRNMSSVKKKVFVGKPLIKPALDILLESGHDIKVWDKGSEITEADWIENVKGVHGIYSFGPQRINKQIIQAAGDQLEVVSVMAVGVDAIDTVELKKRGIRLGHTPDVLTDAVADVTMGLLLCASRRLMEMAEHAKTGKWQTWNPFSPLGVSLKNSTIGIVGLGRIGMAVARRVIPFGVSKIVYTSRSEKSEAAEVNATYGEKIYYPKPLSAFNVVPKHLGQRSFPFHSQAF